MLIKTLVDEDFLNYKKPAMFIGTARCNWKCCIEQGINLSVCQNSELSNFEDIDVGVDFIISRYLRNFITTSIVFGGLEPFDQFDDLFEFTHRLRNVFNDNSDIVVYTGYYVDEIQDLVNKLSEFKNVVIKFGRYIPNVDGVFDNVLGVYLASNNQYAIRY